MPPPQFASRKRDLAVLSLGPWCRIFHDAPDCKPFFLAIDPYGPEFIHQSHVCRIREVIRDPNK